VQESASYESAIKEIDELLAKLDGDKKGENDRSQKNHFFQKFLPVP